MIPRITVSVNTTAFKRKILTVKGKILLGSVTGMRSAVEELRRDAMNVIPRCPVRSGWLRSHHRTYADQIAKTVIGVLETYDTPYAAAVHEGIRRGSRAFRYKNPGEGAKWIESKVLMFRRKYIRIIEKGIKSAL